MTDGVDGLVRDKTRPPRIAPLDQAVLDRVVALTNADPPHEATHWTAAAMAATVGVSVSSVQRIWRAHQLRPHRLRSFKEPDPGPRPHPTRPADEAGVARNHDPRLQTPRDDHAVRCAERARRQGDRPQHATPPAEFIRFLHAVEGAVPAGTAIHAILDSYAAHKHPKVRAWLARHPRWTFHFTPTSCSWLNAVEGFFAKLSKRRLKRGVFRSVADLQTAINRYQQ